MPPTGAVSVVSRELLVECGDGGVGGGDASLRHADLLGPGASQEPLERRLRGLDPALGDIEPRFGDVDPSGGVVALLLRAALALEQQLVALQVGVGVGHFGPGGDHLGVRRFDLGPRLADVLGTGGSAHQPQLRLGRGPIGSRAIDGQDDVGGVEA